MEARERQQEVAVAEARTSFKAVLVVAVLGLLGSVAGGTAIGQAAWVAGGVAGAALGWLLVKR